MTTPAIITVAITGAIPRKADTAAVPITPNEQIESTRQAYEAGATWSAASVARHQLGVNRWCLEFGGHLRTGLEGNIKFDKDRLARSNAELVAGLASLCG